MDRSDKIDACIGQMDLVAEYPVEFFPVASGEADNLSVKCPFHQFHESRSGRHDGKIGGALFSSQCQLHFLRHALPYDRSVCLVFQPGLRIVLVDAKPGVDIKGSAFRVAVEEAVVKMAQIGNRVFPYDHV
ncbi:hypothetical protein LZK73_20490 [Neorhizobium galegae]|nr:hypothetical protein LZK73_20490 [Neorhizobium galegae]